jgi:hypothetical protein
VLTNKSSLYMALMRHIAGELRAMDVNMSVTLPATADHNSFERGCQLMPAAGTNVNVSKLQVTLHLDARLNIIIMVISNVYVDLSGLAITDLVGGQLEINSFCGSGISTYLPIVYLETRFAHLENFALDSQGVAVTHDEHALVLTFSPDMLRRIGPIGNSGMSINGDSAEFTGSDAFERSRAPETP